MQIKPGTSNSPSSALQLDYTYGARVNGVLDVTKNNGNVERQTISFTGLNAQQAYTYDALNRLKTMSELGGWSQTYSYDRFGNRWVSAGNVPSPQQTPQTQSSFDAATNRINPSVMIGFGYDVVGNLTSDPTTPANGIAYDGENRQTSYTKSGVGTTSYSYDGDGRRVKRITGSPAVTTIYVYDVASRLVAEYNDSQQQPAGGTKYLTADHLGSTRVVTGQNQSVVARYDYLPFGEEIGAGVGSRTLTMGYGGADSTKQKFTSKERDMESGLDYFGARYYSSAQGRFTSVDQGIPDPLDPQSWNRYQYARNNPLYYIDTDGNADKPAKDERVNQALATDPTLLRVIKASPNWSQEQFEQAFDRGELRSQDLKTHGGNQLRGAAGEAIVIDSLNNDPGLFAAHVGSQPNLLGTKPDVGAGFVAGKFNVGGAEVTIRGALGNIVLNGQGAIGGVKLSENIKFAFFEVKAGFDVRGVLQGVEQLKGMADSLRKTGIPGVAVLTVASEAWNKLNPEARQKAYNDARVAGGYIQVLNGFAAAAKNRAQSVVDETRKRKQEGQQ